MDSNAPSLTRRLVNLLLVAFLSAHLFLGLALTIWRYRLTIIGQADVFISANSETVEALATLALEECPVDGIIGVIASSGEEGSSSLRYLLYPRPVDFLEEGNFTVDVSCFVVMGERDLELEGHVFAVDDDAFLVVPEGS